MSTSTWIGLVAARRDRCSETSRCPRLWTTTDDRSQFVEALADALERFMDELACRVGVVFKFSLRELQVDHRGYQPLLRPIVEIPGQLAGEGWYCQLCNSECSHDGLQRMARGPRFALAKSPG